MKFLIQNPTNENKNAFLIYESEGYAFDTEQRDQTDFTSIMINDLQFEIDDEGRIMYAWGYCPLIGYELTDEAPVKYSKKSLKAVLPKPPIPGVSYRLNEDRSWPIYINKNKGWVCLGNPQIKGKQFIEFAPDCVATMEGQEIIAVWMHPRELPNLD